MPVFALLSNKLALVFSSAMPAIFHPKPVVSPDATLALVKNYHAYYDRRPRRPSREAWCAMSVPRPVSFYFVTLLLS